VGVFPKSHGGVVSDFGVKFVLTGVFPEGLGKDLADAEAARDTYEYSVAVSVGKSEAEAILLNAQRFVNAMKKHLEK